MSVTTKLTSIHTINIINTMASLSNQKCLTFQQNVEIYNEIETRVAYVALATDYKSGVRTLASSWLKREGGAVSVHESNSVLYDVSVLTFFIPDKGGLCNKDGQNTLAHGSLIEVACLLITRKYYRYSEAV